MFWSEASNCSGACSFHCAMPSVNAAGAITFTRMPSGPQSFAATLLRPHMASFADP